MPCSFTFPRTRSAIGMPSSLIRSWSTYSGFFDPPTFAANSEKNMAMMCSLAVLESGVMFETRFQTYWADVDAAGIVHLPHFFEFISQAEEELFRSAGADRDRLIQ